MARGQDSPADPIEAKNLNDFLCFVIYSTNLAVNRYGQDDQTVGDLAEKLFLDSSTLTPLLKRLETTSNPATRSGRRAAGAGAPHSAADFHHLRERLVKLRTNLSDLVPEKA